MATVTNYILRGIPADLWRKVKAKAALDGLSVREVILRMLHDYAKETKR
jgi:hypothetical protein